MNMLNDLPLKEALQTLVKYAAVLELKTPITIDFELRPALSEEYQRELFKRAEERAKSNGVVLNEPYQLHESKRKDPMPAEMRLQVARAKIEILETEFPFLKALPANAKEDNET